MLARGRAPASRVQSPVSRFPTSMSGRISTNLRYCCCSWLFGKRGAWEPFLPLPSSRLPLSLCLKQSSGYDGAANTQTSPVSFFAFFPLQLLPSSPLLRKTWLGLVHCRATHLTRSHLTHLATPQAIRVPAGKETRSLKLPRHHSPSDWNAACPRQRLSPHPDNRQPPTSACVSSRLYALTRITPPSARPLPAVRRSRLSPVTPTRPGLTSKASLAASALIRPAADNSSSSSSASRSLGSSS
jgi:hypothetical protein